MNEYQKDTQALIAALEAYREKYGGGYDTSCTIPQLVEYLKEDLEERQ